MKKEGLGEQYKRDSPGDSRSTGGKRKGKTQRGKEREWRNKHKRETKMEGEVSELE